jgi:hypothetical protein
MSDLHNSEIRNPKSEIFYVDLLGKEYAHNGRGPEYYDCWGMCMEIYKRLGRELPEFLPAVAEPACIHDVVDNAKGNFTEIPKPVPYCLVTFMVCTPYVTHIGVVLEDINTFIHLLKKSRVTIERLDSLAWARRIKGFYLHCPPPEGAGGGINAG